MHTVNLTPMMKIRPSNIGDLPQIFELYKRVAATPGGIARVASEVDAEYVNYFLVRSLTSGISKVATDENGSIVGEIHAYRPGQFCFSHVLSELTIVVDPAVQGNGVGRQIFEAFMDTVSRSFAGISRVELVARESNVRAIRFYESMGFSQEGKLRGRIRNVDGSFESDIPMGWVRPAGKPDSRPAA